MLKQEHASTQFPYAGLCALILMHAHTQHSKPIFFYASLLYAHACFSMLHSSFVLFYALSTCSCVLFYALLSERALLCSIPRPCSSMLYSSFVLFYALFLVRALLCSFLVRALLCSISRPCSSMLYFSFMLFYALLTCSCMLFYALLSVRALLCSILRACSSLLYSSCVLFYARSTCSCVLLYALLSVRALLCYILRARACSSMLCYILRALLCIPFHPCLTHPTPNKINALKQCTSWTPSSAEVRVEAAARSSFLVCTHQLLSLFLACAPRFYLKSYACCLSYACAWILNCPLHQM
jgi:hypothetical protein